MLRPGAFLLMSIFPIEIFSEPPSESSHISRDRAILIQFALTLSGIVS